MKMRILLESINTADFNVSKREHPLLGDVVLVSPRKGKFSWGLDEIHLRSLLCSVDGDILCSGFHKFMNYGERPELDHITEESILSGNALFVEKMDGSLIVRTVIDGEVCFRTRGSHSLGDFEEQVMTLVRNKYPGLLDVDAFDETVSALFEYVSPDNRIIVKYEDSELTFLGVMIHSEDKAPKFFSNPSLIDSVHDKFGVRKLEFYDLPSNMDDVVKEISGWTDKEGIVVWCRMEDGSFHLAKIKAAEYLRLHALRYHLSSDKIRKLCYSGKVTCEADLQYLMRDLDVDWEVMSFVLPTLNDYLDTKKRVEEEISEFFVTLDEHNVKGIESRKRLANALKNICGRDRKLFAIGMSYALGEEEKLERAILAMQLGVPRNALAHFIEDAEAIAESLLRGLSNG
jgi:hypothetical protein